MQASYTATQTQRASLKEQGLLSEEEFQQMKAGLLGHVRIVMTRG